MGNVPLLETGVKVGQSESALLTMLGIKPFQYGFDILNIYDSGSVFAPAILDITPEDIRAKFVAGVANIAAVSLNIGYPTIASVPHSIANGFRNIIAIATDIEFEQVATLKAYLADPSAFAVACEVEEAVEEEAAPAPVEEDESSDDDMGFDMFG